MSDRPALGTLVLPVQCLACRRLWEVRVPGRH
jgi:hypothetical protein